MLVGSLSSAFSNFRLFLVYCFAFICHIAFPPTREAYLMASRLAIKKTKKRKKLAVNNAYQMR